MICDIIQIKKYYYEHTRSDKMSYIEFNNVCKEYQMGEIVIQALNNTNFKIEKGELVVIVGPSGARKNDYFKHFRRNGYC